MKTLLDKLSKKTLEELCKISLYTETKKDKNGCYSHDETSLKLVYLLEYLNFGNFSKEMTLGEIVNILCENLDIEKFKKENDLE